MTVDQAIALARRILDLRGWQVWKVGVFDGGDRYCGWTDVNTGTMWLDPSKADDMLDTILHELAHMESEAGHGAEFSAKFDEMKRWWEGDDLMTDLSKKYSARWWALLGGDTSTRADPDFSLGPQGEPLPFSATKPTNKSRQEVQDEIDSYLTPEQLREIESLFAVAGA